MEIRSISAREIFDSRGVPTVQVSVELEDGSRHESSAPSGASCGSAEAVVLRDGGKRLMGLGVTKAIEKVNTLIGPALVGRAPDLVMCDVMMLELDGTETKSNLGANATVAVSCAIARAQAYVANIELYELMAQLSESDQIALPAPMLNMINGGAHADNGLSIQEFLIIPTEFDSFRAAFEAGTVFFHLLKAELKKQGKRVAVGDEGGFAPDFNDEREVLDLLTSTIALTKKQCGGNFSIGLDVAASQFYDAKKKKYNWQGKLLSTDALIALYQDLIATYPITSIEDGLHEADYTGWAAMTKALRSSVALIGDDLFVTNAEKIWQGIEENYATGAIIKPNQIGTVTETLQAIRLCKENNFDVIVSHRSGETNDDFIADLAVGVSANAIKAGGCSRGERLAKYNRLLEIEDALALSVLLGR